MSYCACYCSCDQWCTTTNHPLPHQGYHQRDTKYLSKRKGNKKKPLERVLAQDLNLDLVVRRQEGWVTSRRAFFLTATMTTTKTKTKTKTTITITITIKKMKNSKLMDSIKMVVPPSSSPPPPPPPPLPKFTLNNHPACSCPTFLMYITMSTGVLSTLYIINELTSTTVICHKQIVVVAVTTTTKIFHPQRCPKQMMPCSSS